MQNNKKINYIITVVLALVFVAASYGVNLITSPIIQENNKGAKFASLLEVMPEATDFEALYEKDGDSTINVESDKVVGIYKETSGKGYVVKLSTSEGYTHLPIEFTIAIDNEGKISGVALTSYPESKDFGADYPYTYIGQDSTLANVELVSQVTFSSSAFKNAVIEGFDVMVANELVGAGVKSDDQILSELLLRKDGSFVNGSGSAQMEEVTGSGNIVKAYKSLNGAGFAAIVNENDKALLVLVNPDLAFKAYDVEENEVELSETLASEVKTLASSNFAKFDKAEKKLAKLVGADLEEIVAENVFSSVAKVYKAGNKYAFITVPYHFSNKAVNYYYVLDSNGTIISMSADEFAVEAEYFSEYNLDEEAYKEGFVGVNADNLSEDVYLVAGATFTTSAAKVSVNDVLEAYAIITGGNN